MPVFAGSILTGVVVFFCGDDEAHVGAIELWHNDPDKSFEMRLVDGYYGTAEMFEFNSKYTRFPRGFGSLKNFAFRLLEAWRNCLLLPHCLAQIDRLRCQIRLDTS